MSGLPSIVWTRELLLEAAGFEAVEDVRRAVRRHRQALNARTKEGAPDHAVRLKAAELIYDIADVRKPRAGEADASRPVNVQIILDARTPVQANGVRLHLSSGDGENGHGGHGA